MKNIIFLLLFAMMAFSTGCSIKHPIAKDYSQYLVNNEGANALPKTELEADYLIDKETMNHRYEFRAAVVGFGNLWIVEFGKILDETLKSKDVQSAFGKLLKRADGNQGNGHLISFRLEKYAFENYRAYISLNITLANEGSELLNKTYNAEGKAQGGKMFGGGVFAMKNATQQSTKLALDKILGEFIRDVNSK